MTLDLPAVSRGPGPEPTRRRWVGARTPGARALCGAKAGRPGLRSGRRSHRRPTSRAAPWPRRPSSSLRPSSSGSTRAPSAAGAGAAGRRRRTRRPSGTRPRATPARRRTGSDAAGIAATAGGGADATMRTATSEAAPIPSTATPAKSAWRRRDCSARRRAGRRERGRQGRGAAERCPDGSGRRPRRRRPGLRSGTAASADGGGSGTTRRRARGGIEKADSTAHPRRGARRPRRVDEGVDMRHPRASLGATDGATPTLVAGAADGPRRHGPDGRRGGDCGTPARVGGSQPVSEGRVDRAGTPAGAAEAGSSRGPRTRTLRCE